MTVCAEIRRLEGGGGGGVRENRMGDGGETGKGKGTNIKYAYCVWKNVSFY